MCAYIYIYEYYDVCYLDVSTSMTIHIITNVMLVFTNTNDMFITCDYYYY